MVPRASVPNPARGRESIPWEEWRRLRIAAKLGFAWRGLRLALADLSRRGAAGRATAILVAPIGVVYVIGTVLRDTVIYRPGSTVGRRSAERSAYLRHRFGGTQRLVNWREQRLVASLLRRAGPAATVLDVPSGYGRFTAALEQVTGGRLTCTDLDGSRLAALRRAGSHRPSSVVRADLQGRLPFASGAFDLVFNLRYLHQAHTAEARRHTLQELARVSRGFVLVSYYRGSNLHALVRGVQRQARGNRRRSPTMISRQEFDRLVRGVGYRTLCDRPVLPWMHAQRLALLKRTPAPTGARSAERDVTAAWPTVHHGSERHASMRASRPVSPDAGPPRSVSTGSP